MALLQELRYICLNCNDIHPELLIMAGGELESEFKQLCPIHKIWGKDTLFKRVMRRLKVRRFVYPYLYMFSKNQFDVIYANTVVTLEIGCHLKRLLGIPLIGHIHEGEALMHMFCVKSEWLQSCDFLISVSTLAKQNLLENYGVSPNKLVLHRPISFWVEKYKAGIAPLVTESDADGEKLIGCFTNGNWFKATEIIPVLVKLFIDKYPRQRCKFLVVGEIPDEIRFRLMFDLKRMKLNNKVILMGKTENPLNLLSKICVLVLLSREESFSLVAQEAGLMGKPIIGFEGATGAAEWIKEGAGVLVPYMDLMKMADVLYNLLTNDGLRRDCGKTAKELVEKMYQEDSQMKPIVSLIRRF